MPPKKRTKEETESTDNTKKTKTSEASKDATAFNVHNVTVANAQGKDVSMSVYAGKVLLIVNVASKCGRTKAHYTQLAALDDKLKDKGLRIIGFPCNQFGRQEPGTAEGVVCFAKDNYNATFDIMGKVEVNGENASPLFVGLKETTKIKNIPWNFSKFLVSKTGRVLGAYDKDKPSSLEEPILKALSSKE